MALKIADNFSYLGRKPLDERFIYNTKADMTGMSASTLYDGIIVFCKEDEKYYTYNSTRALDPTLGRWREFEAGNTTASCESLVSYQQGVEYHTDQLVLLREDDQIGIVIKNFTADTAQTDNISAFKLDVDLGNLKNITDPSPFKEYVPGGHYHANQLIYYHNVVARTLVNFEASMVNPADTAECFNDDYKKNIFSVINISEFKTTKPYNQNSYYVEEMLIYNGDNLYRTTKHFTSDATVGNTIQQSIDTDVAAGNMIWINEDAKNPIKVYDKNKFYEANDIVYFDSYIARVVADFISDNTQVSVEDAYFLDLKNNKLVSLGSKFKMVIWETNKILNYNIGATDNLTETDIIFSAGENIKDLNDSELIYDAEGTVGVIENIDINAHTLVVKIISSLSGGFHMPQAPTDTNFEILTGGTGYMPNNIVATDNPDIFAKVLTVDGGGGILTLELSDQTAATGFGAGAHIKARKNMYVGNGDVWYKLDVSGLGGEGANILKYEKGASYKKNDLIYWGDVLALVTDDFTASNHLSTDKDCFDLDIQTGHLLRMTPEEKAVPEFLGSAKTEAPADFPQNPIKGNWVLVENCTVKSPSQAGIAVYNGTAWDINVIPSGQSTFTFPEPSDDGKKYFRSRAAGATNGTWELFDKIDGNNVEIAIKTKNDVADNTYKPAVNELVWVSGTNVLVRGDGVNTIGNLKPFYDNTLTKNDLITILGYTPENVNNKGQANGYAPLDSNGIVPLANLPAQMTNVYTKTEVDTKISTEKTALTTLINAEATRATGVENTIKTDLTNHINNAAIHTTQTEKDAWNAKVNASDIVPFTNHLSDTIVHITAAERAMWNGYTKAVFVDNVSALPSTGNHVGNMGYVRTSAAGVTPVSCAQYMWDGSAWKQIDTGQVALQFTWANIQNKPNSTVLAIDNAVTKTHEHTNKTTLDKIGQTATGNFTYNGVEIGIKAVFLDNETLLPAQGQKDTLYVVYEDDRVRKYPSISVWRDNAYQVLGRGTQDAPQVVGNMAVMQSEYFNVAANSKYKINVSPNQYFCFLTVEILKQIPGATNVTKQLCLFNNNADWDYKDYLWKQNSSEYSKINIMARPTTQDVVSNYYHSHVDIDISEYHDITAIM